MRAAVVPCVGAGDAVIGELVAHGRPRLATVVGAWQHLPEPSTALRDIDPIRIGGRALHVVDLPAREVGTGDVPALSPAVRGENEGAFSRADENPYPAHSQLPVCERKGEYRVTPGLSILRGVLPQPANPPGPPGSWEVVARLASTCHIRRPMRLPPIIEYSAIAAFLVAGSALALVNNFVTSEVLRQ